MGGSSWWSSKKTKGDESYPKQSAPVPALKPSAPHPEPAIKKETSHLQQSSNAKPPIGWNVDGTNQNSGWKSGYQAPGLYLGSKLKMINLNSP
ncbi:hypothetical protein NQ314_019456 [Rhamnusium bicolor]|uniref:Uncharacterized protein n=1 Tax=Rhamnusium bicolor TaxID=1586634 RepID=A0AAV8WMV8_9CUCU|nr:hypothetical protein NQ314_019456 [Rhamnusium bicolor]